MKAVTRLSCALGAVATLASCGPDPRGGGGGDDDPRVDGGGGGGVDADTGVCQAMDVMFIIDDSGSMAEEQTNLTANFPQFAQVLTDYRVDGSPLDFRVAVTTTGRDVNYTIDNMGFMFPMSEDGDNGAFRDGCGLGRRWLERTDANLASTFSCRANVGTGGPGFEMPIFMSMMALRERITDGTNLGFLRDDALLALVILTDENDCSRTDDGWTVGIGDDPCTEAGAPHVLPTEMIAFFDELKGGRGRWAAAVIAAPTDCDSTFGTASEAIRLKQLVSEMNSGGAQNGVFSSICEGDLAGALGDALDTFQAACETFPPID
ncbi:MAG: hypothetical protein R2939_08055 [Kofleriaceae bacterium]